MKPVLRKEVCFFRAPVFGSAIIVLLLIIFVSGCTRTPPPRMQFIVPPPQPPVLAEEYVLQPYDTIEVKFFYNPELNDLVMIRPDGKIALQMIDEVSAAGLTPAQLDDVLTQKYGLLLPRVMITVFVRNFTEQKVYVGGEVYLPQVITLTGRMNALQAVFMAGGYKPDARLTDVVIVSRGPDNRPIAREVNLRKALNGDLEFDEYRLKPFDIVYVPKSRIARLDRFMSHLYSFIPPQVGFFFTYEVNDEGSDD